MIDDFIKVDNFREEKIAGLTAWIHKEHRFSLYSIWYAQLLKKINKPVTLILFDAHHDAKKPNDQLMQLLQKSLAEEFSEEQFFIFCKNNLSLIDDDWVTAGMELGIISDVIVYGIASSNYHAYDANAFPNIYTDHKGINHKLFFNEMVPGQSFTFQGNLSDLACCQEYQDYWDTLRWAMQDGTFKLNLNKGDIWVDFDLDCFTINWKDFIFPWPIEVYKRYLLTPSEYFTTAGWTGSKFINELINVSEIFGISEEPDYCGGEKNSNKILQDIREYIFEIS